MPRRGDLKIFACRSAKKFGEKVCDEITKIYKNLGEDKSISLGKCNIKEFADSDFVVRLDDNVRGKDVYIIQTGTRDKSRSMLDNKDELLYFIDAAKSEGKAARVVAVILSFFSARQDKPKGRESYNAKIVAKELEAIGIEGLITVDLHADQIKGFFNNAWVEGLYASNTLIEHLLNTYGEELKKWVYASVDANGFPKVEHYAKVIGAETAISVKRRDYNEPNKVEKVYVLGDVKDKTVCIVDDMIDTAGSLEGAIKELEKKEVKEAIVVATHLLLNKNAIKILYDLYNNGKGKLKKVIGTDTTYEGNYPWLEQVSLTPLIANAIYRINQDLSISEFYNIKPI